MIGSITDSAFDPRPQLGTLLESACPVCMEALDVDDLQSAKRPHGEAVRCETCYQAGRPSVFHRGCSVPFAEDLSLVTDPLDARIWRCTKCVIEAGKVLERRAGDAASAIPHFGAAVMPSLQIQVSESVTDSTLCARSRTLRSTLGRSPMPVLERVESRRPDCDREGSGGPLRIPALGSEESAGPVAQWKPERRGGIPEVAGSNQRPVLRNSLRDVTAHHIAQALIAKALARDLRENTL